MQKNKNKAQEKRRSSPKSTVSKHSSELSLNTSGSQAYITVLDAI